MEKVMVIDSDAHQIRVLNDGLADDYLVLGCNRGTKALELFQVYEPSALVLDPSTPGLNGKEFIRQVRSLPRGRRLPILSLTRITTLKHIEDSFDLGVDMIFSKPCSAERIKLKLNQCLAQSARRPGLEPTAV
jgi:two-component system cell cycle response regulator DivK